MSCFNHHDRNAIRDCEQCGKPICAECGVDVHGEILCKECVKGAVKSNNNRGHYSSGHYEPKMFYSTSKRYSSFLTFLCSFLPGAGFMYLGLMKHGILVMCTFLLSIYINTILEGSFFFGLAMGFIATTSFFYTFKLKNKLNNGEFVEDNIDHIIVSMKKYAAVPIIIFILEMVKNLIRNFLWNFNLDSHFYRSGRIMDYANLFLIVIVLAFAYRIYSRDKTKKDFDSRNNNDFIDKR